MCLNRAACLPHIEIKKTANPGREQTRGFSPPDRSSAPHGKGAVICMELQLAAIDLDSHRYSIGI